jgi:hypothetical protein
MSPEGTVTLGPNTSALFFHHPHPLPPTPPPVQPHPLPSRQRTHHGGLLLLCSTQGSLQTNLRATSQPLVIPEGLGLFARRGPLLKPAYPHGPGRVRTSQAFIGEKASKENQKGRVWVGGGGDWTPHPRPYNRGNKPPPPNLRQGCKVPLQHLYVPPKLPQGHLRDRVHLVVRGGCTGGCCTTGRAPTLASLPILARRG